MNRYSVFFLAIIHTGFSVSAHAESEPLGDLQFTNDGYEQRLRALEAQQQSLTAFNPQLSIILDGQFTAYKHHAEDYELPGFIMGGEAGLAPEGMSLGHTEISASAPIDDRFFGKFTAAIHSEGAESAIELEEAFIQTTSMPAGLGVQAGRFFSALGYINEQHEHAWDFADAPLAYRGLWGNKYIDDGVRLNWLAPSDLYIELGAEAFSGGRFPAGGEAAEESGSQLVYFKLGGDWSLSQSWLLGLSLHQADVKHREAGGHADAHGEEALDALAETPVFSGDSETAGLSAVYKWAPDGNYRNRHFKLQTEIFVREEMGELELEGSDPLEVTDVSLKQKGAYMQAIYQFRPQWRLGLRYDLLESDNSALDDAVLDEAGLHDEGLKPKRSSVMLEWLPSEFSRIRFQLNDDRSYEDKETQFILQYTMSMGAHGAHTF